MNASGAGYSTDAKIQKQMAKRGWDDAKVKETIDNPAKTAKTTDTRFGPDGIQKPPEPATAFFSADGSYLVRNDATGNIVQVSNRLDPNWKAPSTFEFNK